MKPIAIKYAGFLIIIIMFNFLANAQKLPNVQQGGLYAPADVKIDGKTTEWDNKFQAYNKSTSVFYTMANNNDNLLLVVQATDKTAIGKILGGGITLTIADKNKANTTVSITTPVTSAPNRSNIAKVVGGTSPVSDSLLSELNKGLQNNFKEIGLKGIAAISDSSLSVYNEYGIKVSGLLDINRAYNCELAIPLKYLRHLVADDGSFNYNIRLNGVKYIKTMLIDGQPIDQASPAAAAVLMNLKLDGSPIMELNSPTDFSSTYTLIKKP
ncbi:MAG: hypothetical protein ABI367_05385 [Mucilaginibacter sp.]